MVFDVRVSVVSSEELLNFFIMAVSTLILPINNGYYLERLLQNFMVCGVQFVENWGVRSNYSLIGWCMSYSLHQFILTILDKYERSSSPQPF